MADRRLTLREAAAQAGVTPATLRRWAESGVIPDGAAATADGGWSPAAVAHARLVARLRERGHTLDAIRRAGEEGRLAYGLLEDLFPRGEERYSLDEVADEIGLERELVERIWMSLGLPRHELETLSDDDVRALRYVAAVLEAGFPLVAMLQMSRVYGQTLAQVADAETRLFHLYVHEPLMREGVPGLQLAEEMEGLARDLLPLATPLMEYIHTRFLQQSLEQDVVGHMEQELDSEPELGRMRVAVAFADLAGYTRFVEEEGEEEALSYVERFIDAVANTLPDDARVVKTIGDEVMIVGQHVEALAEWAVGFLQLYQGLRPAPRIGLNVGPVIYRDGDYYGREVNLASRVVARARGGEVLATADVARALEEDEHLVFENIGQMKLKGFDEPRPLCRVLPAPEE